MMNAGNALIVGSVACIAGCLAVYAAGLSNLRPEQQRRLQQGIALFIGVLAVAIILVNPNSAD